MRKLKFFITLLMSGFITSCDYHPPILAGGEEVGYVDGVGEKAKFSSLQSGAIDSNGNLFLIDKNKIRKVTPDGLVSTFAGTDKGTEQEGDIKTASFIAPWQLLTDTQDNIFINDNGKKIKIITNDGLVTTIIGNNNSFEANSNNKLVKINIGALGLAGFDLNQNLYFSNNYIYYKLDKNNIITEFSKSLKINEEYGSYFIGFNPKSLDLYFIKGDTYGYFDYYYKFNLNTSEITKLFTRTRSFTLQVLFTTSGLGYQLFDSKISKVDENLKESNEIYSFGARLSKSGDWGLVRTNIVLDEKRKILYVIESGYYHRIYKINLN